LSLFKLALICSRVVMGEISSIEWWQSTFRAAYLSID
jgi:hypothetical protein